MDNLTLEAGDDAGKVKWMDISNKLKLYASHAQFIKSVAEKRDAHWSEDSQTSIKLEFIADIHPFHLSSIISS